MEITGIGRLRIGKWPIDLDIEIDSADNLSAEIFLVGTKARKKYETQIVRVLLKKNNLGIFMSRYADFRVPAYWVDAELIWEHQQPLAQDE